jgi:hypothetical protein
MACNQLRRGAADGGEYREAAGAFAEVVAMLALALNQRIKAKD